MNLASMIDKHPEDAVALISRGRLTTYGALRRQVAALRGGLVGLGLEPGDRIALVLANNWYFAVSYLAALSAGLVVVPLNPLSPPRELEMELAAVGARALVVGPSARAAVASMDRRATPELEFEITAKSARGDGAGDTVTLDQLLESEPTPPVDRSDDDLAVLVFTSGTAGSPKAAMITHGNLRSNISQMLSAEETPTSGSDVQLGVLPLFHIFGLNAVLGAGLTAGSSILLIERFDPLSALEAIVKHKVTIVSGAPTMWSAWAGLPDADRSAMATVRRATSGAARLPMDTFNRIKERFGIDLREGYGLTEASPVVATAIGMDLRPGTIGTPIPGVEVRLVDLDGHDALVGDPGEIWVRGPNVFIGYWNDPQATRNVLTPDGWLQTGDIAVVDEDGYLSIVDRMKDLIIVSGFNVFPAEVEEVLLMHPAIDSCAVVGVTHPYSGEAVKAYVVVTDTDSIEEEDVIAFCADRLARYKCPSKVMFVDELPQGAGGKVLRRALR